MTDKEIIKAYDIQKAEIEYCYEFIEQLKEARNILDDKCKKQQTEIEFLQSSKNLHEAEFESLKSELELAKAFHKEAVAERDLLNIQLKGANAEIERLEKRTEMYHELRAEVVKEFAERLKDEIKDTRFAYEAEEQCECIDNLVKEMVGDSE